MTSEKLEVIRGSGNVFRDFERSNSDVEQSKAILAAEIIKVLDRDGLTVRAAFSRTGIAAADFSRIRNAKLGRFTVDRLMSILNRLGSRVDVRPASGSTIDRAPERHQSSAAVTLVQQIISTLCGGSMELLLIGMLDREILDESHLRLLSQKLARSRKRRVERRRST